MKVRQERRAETVKLPARRGGAGSRPARGEPRAALRPSAAVTAFALLNPGRSSAEPHGVWRMVLSPEMLKYLSPHCFFWIVLVMVELAT